jgi:hypothetical protein
MTSFAVYKTARSLCCLLIHINDDRVLREEKSFVELNTPIAQVAALKKLFLTYTIYNVCFSVLALQRQHLKLKYSSHSFNIPTSYIIRQNYVAEYFYKKHC